MNTFGSRLHALREDNDLTSIELSEILNITARALNYYENDMREPSFPLLVKMADYFNVSLDYLLCRTNKLEPFK
ncbi:helix-turn-helix domain-containing protein [Clostridium sporogenes]|uniref:helix-turn-helix domain-containing protein n=1 Tax=Clostridium sporogenes TaxID=1509 RepID=UPI0013C71E99|nr:helix-turn-helix transcriptional regulator [Clostridium sporogenes]MDU4599522.1 helix-turn-helix transcriptional regulator [Clostridium sporogenes]NFQ35309.1 helix-turn-helix transcriptional regulator [Clostridium sporogenes]NFQ61817.1 helix-turn-helix transcriptional regulator [Clostridium sporogenes]NFU10579.1 helix-turn-helix transcriptional regulator [Clostridium sporogenes]NFU44704.1 helix-turn-helix transcriptional regulator [Clostridium sporogenes]